MVAFGNRTDRYHEWAVSIATKVESPMLTCESVLAEASFHLGSAALVLDFVRTGLVRPDFILADNFERISDLATRYRDRKPDLADLCVIRMSELHPRHVVATTDIKDFRVYRRNGKELIPLLCPSPET